MSHKISVKALVVNFLFSILFLALAKLSMANEEKNMGNFMFDLTSEIKIYEGKYEFQLQLRNTSERALFFYGGFLSRDAITMLLVQSSAYGRVLDETRYIDDPTPGRVEVKPKGIYTKTIKLNRIYKSMNLELDKSPLILFWSANIKPVDSQIEEKRFGGYILLKK